MNLNRNGNVDIIKMRDTLRCTDRYTVDKPKKEKISVVTVFLHDAMGETDEIRLSYDGRWDVYIN